MNKVLVFTNVERWYDLDSEFDVDNALWNAKYDAIEEELVLKYGIKDGIAVLTELPMISFEEEGVYFVYDRIDETKLKQLLSQCANDEVFALIHNTGVKKNSFGDDVIVLQGNHDSEPEHRYIRLFNLLTKVEEDDTIATKVNRVIDEIFLEEVISKFVGEFYEPNKNMGQSARYRILSKMDKYKEALEAFRKKYESCRVREEYIEDYIQLRDMLNSGKP